MSAATAERQTVPTWGYHATEPARIFDIPEGRGLPAGWYDHPDKALAKPKGRRADDKR